MAWPLVPPRKFLWLNGIGLFEILPNRGHGSCLFRSIAQALSPVQTDEDHGHVRRRVVRHITSPAAWALFKTRILTRWRAKLRSHAKLDAKAKTEPAVMKEFKRRMGRKSESGTFYELLAAGDTYGFHLEYLTLVHSCDFDHEQNEGSVRRYIFFGCRTQGCRVGKDRPHVLFYYTRYPDGDGHWELLCPLYWRDETAVIPLNRKICGKIYNRMFMDGDSESTPSFEEYAQEFIQIGESIANSSAASLLLDDPDWPADDQDDYRGCAAPDYVPKGASSIDIRTDCFWRLRRMVLRKLRRRRKVRVAPN